MSGHRKGDKSVNTDRWQCQGLIKILTVITVHTSCIYMSWYVFEKFLSCHFSKTVNMILSSYFATFSCGFSINNITLSLMYVYIPRIPLCCRWWGWSRGIPAWRSWATYRWWCSVICSPWTRQNTRGKSRTLYYTLYVTIKWR